MRATEAGGQSAEQATGLPQVSLEITRGRARHRRRDVRTRAFLIGSAADNDLVLGDPRFDELHSYVLLSPRKVTVRRLGEGPTLSVGDVPVMSAALEDCDRLRLGPFEFQVRINWPTSAARAERPPIAALAQPHSSLDADPALERLLRDIEALTPAPQVRLFVGDPAERGKAAQKPGQDEAPLRRKSS